MKHLRLVGTCYKGSTLSMRPVGSIRGNLVVYRPPTVEGYLIPQGASAQARENPHTGVWSQSHGPGPIASPSQPASRLSAPGEVSKVA